VKAVLVNIFGGITRCDEVAHGLLKALDQNKSAVPIIARLVGTNSEEGNRLLAEAGITACNSLTDAATKAVELAGVQ